MDLMEDYLSIREFAERAGVSPQSIYKGLTTRLSTYCLEVDNQKVLSVRALSEVYGVEVDNQVGNQSAQVDNPDSTQDLLIQTLQSQVEDLRRQVEVKDEQIAGLHRMMEQQNALALAEKGVMFQLTEGGHPAEDGTLEPESSAAAEGKKWYQFWK